MAHSLHSDHTLAQHMAFGYSAATLHPSSFEALNCAHSGFERHPLIHAHVVSKEERTGAVELRYEHRPPLPFT